MQKKIRVLWLLNHATLRRFEVSQFHALGIHEIFTPKSFPYDEGNLSASVDESLDASLTIPPEDLSILNAQNWYESPSDEAWKIANQHFDVAIIGAFPRQIASVVRHFQGAIVLRVFGLARDYSYTRLIQDELGAHYIEKLKHLGERFWFGAGYAHLKDGEGAFLRSRDCFLPVGLDGTLATDAWEGSDKRIFFVCPRIETSPYFNAVYKKFITDFAGIGHLIGGAQPLKVADPGVLGFVPRAMHERHMREMRVMFYHSTEPNHIHYHPFEAICAGMPLVFMAGGMLDRLGGENLPGRCKTTKEARRKIERILGDDHALIASIRQSQVVLLEPMRAENCETAWREGFRRILAVLERPVPVAVTRKRRIAVIVPVGYRGGSLRGAKLLAQAIQAGSVQAGEEAEVILAHLDDPACYPDEEFADLPRAIKRRPYQWRLLGREEACRALAYAGLEQPVTADVYQVPDDGIRQFMDCDLWVIVSDRLEHPLLPLRPYVSMVYDYLQRYENLLPQAINSRFIHAAHAAERVFVTTEFTRQDALQFAGLPGRKVKKLPMLAPDFSASRPSAASAGEPPYFLWTTNLAPHKNHENALNALRHYYEALDGRLACHVTGAGTEEMLVDGGLAHFEPLRAILQSSPALKKNLRIQGELPDRVYRARLSGCAFLWHTGRMDNGTFSVIEAAHCGIPALSSDYPAMRETDRQFGLNLAWMDPHDPENMARQLKRMEHEAADQSAALPSPACLAEQSATRLAGAYWGAVRECL